MVLKASFEVQAGSICALLGPNGAGKSTIIKMLTGLTEPSSGAAIVGGIPVESAALKNIIGVLPESLALFDSLTVEEHLQLTGAACKKFKLMTFGPEGSSYCEFYGSRTFSF